jgi:hypothetical protein
VGCSLLDCGLLLPERPEPAGPDFKVGLSDGRILWVECVTFLPGDPSTKDAENLLPTEADYDSRLKNEEDGSYAGHQHSPQLALRVAGSFKSKLEKFVTYAKDYNGPTDCVVFAIGPAKIESRLLHDNLTDDLAIARLFASFRDTNMIDLASGPILKLEGVTRKFGAQEPVTKPFEERGAELVSGVLFSARSIVSSSYQWEDDLVWIENYNAARPLDVFVGKLRSILMRADGRRLSSIELRPKGY